MKNDKIVLTDGKLAMRLTFRSKKISREGTQEAVEMVECVELPEIAIMRERKRFLWKDRVFLRVGDDELEQPDLKTAVTQALILRNVGHEKTN